MKKNLIEQLKGMETLKNIYYLKRKQKTNLAVKQGLVYYS